MTILFTKKLFEIIPKKIKLKRNILAFKVKRSKETFK